MAFSNPARQVLRLLKEGSNILQHARRKGCVHRLIVLFFAPSVP